MSATRPEPVVLEGRYLRLEPFSPAHLDGLWRALAHPEVFSAGYGGGPSGLPADRAAFDAWCLRYGVGPTAIRYVARLVGGPYDGGIVGASTLGDLDETREHAHIGWTGWDPRVWGTQVNPEAKLMMLGTAFSHGYGRVKLQADAINDRSRSAILRLGATFEGIVRRDVQRADGTWRDTAQFSILADEWPGVRAGLEARLNGFNGKPVLLRGGSRHGRG